MDALHQRLTAWLQSLRIDSPIEVGGVVFHIPYLAAQKNTCYGNVFGHVITAVRGSGKTPLDIR